MTRPILAVGWDVGGWVGRRHGFAAFHVDGDQPILVSKPFATSLRSFCDSDRCGELDFRSFLTRVIGDAEGIDIARARVVLALDAPLGFPTALGSLVRRRPTAAWNGRKQWSNPYAYRRTDDHIRLRFKTPLSASFDKLGNNATVAMHYLHCWRRDNGLAVLPFDMPSSNSPVAIEVYPAIVRTAKRGQRPDWYRQLAGEWARRTGDAADAVVCAALALAWAAKGRWGLPPLRGAPTKLPPTDGWIFYPKDMKWK